jgi:hypothetical protein
MKPYTLTPTGTPLGAVTFAQVARAIGLLEAVGAIPGGTTPDQLTDPAVTFGVGRWPMTTDTEQQQTGMRFSDTAHVAVVEALDGFTKWRLANLDLDLTDAGWCAGYRARAAGPGCCHGCTPCL